MTNPEKAGVDRHRSIRIIAHSHRVVALCLVAFGIFGALEASGLGLGRPTQPGPGLWPLILAALMVAASVVVLFTDKRSDYEEWTKRSGIVLAGLGLLGLFVLAFTYLGFPISTALLLVVWLRMMAHQSWRSTLLLSVGGTSVLYFIFAFALEVPFPDGILLSSFGVAL